MSAVAFDTLKYSKCLKDAGVPEKQAEVEAEACKYSTNPSSKITGSAHF